MWIIVIFYCLLANLKLSLQLIHFTHYPNYAQRLPKLRWKVCKKKKAAKKPSIKLTVYKYFINLLPSCLIRKRVVCLQNPGTSFPPVRLMTCSLSSNFILWLAFSRKQRFHKACLSFTTTFAHHPNQCSFYYTLAASHPCWHSFGHC